MLNLTPDQKAKADPIVAQAKTEMDAIRKEAHDRIMALMQTTRGQLQPILTAEQEQKLDAMQKSAPAAPGKPGPGVPGKPGGPGGHRGNMLARLASALNLTDDQKAKIQPIFDGARPQFQAVFHDTSLSQADKMAKIKAIRDDTIIKIKQFLTPDQQAKLDQLRDRMDHRRQGAAQNAPPGGAPPGPPPVPPPAAPQPAPPAPPQT
jgi:Spy/CpxP family protein refolding chaperone